MRNIGKMVRIGICTLGMSVMALPGLALAMDHGAMGGMNMGGSGDHAAMDKKDGGHDMTKMGDKLYSGKLGVWKAEARLIDMAAHMKAMPGMKMEGTMPNSHHVAVSLTDSKTKAAITEGTGKVTVTGPDKKSVTSDFMVMQGHFGADVNLPKPGKYTFKVEITSGGKTGSETFTHKVK
ncbi:MAG TPA: hypothetical protein VGK27_13940 [Candidatus Deferrimicrobiaceae bacterium]